MLILVKYAEIRPLLLIQKTCKWYTHLTYLHLEIHSLKINCKIQTKTSARTPSWVTELFQSVMRCVDSRGKVVDHFLWDPGSMNVTINRKNIDFVT